MCTVCGANPSDLIKTKTNLGAKSDHPSNIFWSRRYIQCSHITTPLNKSVDATQLNEFCQLNKFHSIIFSDLKVDPVNITNTVPSSTSVGLTWQPPDPYKLGEAVSEYRVEIYDLLRGERFNYTVNSSSTNAELNFLKPFTRYEFKVFGSTSSWQGNITDTISLKTQEDGMF